MLVSKKKKKIIYSITPVKIFRLDDGSLSRCLDRLSIHISSLLSQDGYMDLKPVVSDLTTDPDIQRDIKSLCSDIGANYVHTKTNLVWNKPLALNVGIKSVPRGADHICTTDMDIVFRKDVISKCLDSTEKILLNRFIRFRLPPLVIARTFMINKDKTLDIINNFKKTEDLIGDYPDLFSHGEFLCDSGSGGIQFFDRDWIFKVKGYDERYSLWGAMDNEITKRAEMSRKIILRINKAEKEDICLAHLHHDAWRATGVDREYIMNNKIQKNKEIFENNVDIYVNKESWGIESNIIGPRYVDGTIRVC